MATGAGLTGGPISTTGTVAVATGGITTALLADGAVGLAKINTAEVQARVAMTCPPGQYLRGINPNGTVVCEPFFVPNFITTVDDAGSVGEFSSIAIGTDGLPVISYWDGTNNHLKVAKCGNAACSAGNAISTVDTDRGGTYTSIAIGADGLPVISYYYSFISGLRVAKCGNAACSAGNAITTVDANFVGKWTSIAIGTDGLPVISYLNETAGKLKVAKCGNAACSSGNTITTVEDPANVVGGFTSIAIGTDGLPVISYFELTGANLKVAHCENAACSAATITAVDASANLVGQYNSIAIGVDGLPVISYWDITAGTLKVAHCGNVACSAGNTITTVDDPGNDVGSYTSIVIGADGLPVISYWDRTIFALKVAHCGNAACSAGNTISTVDDPANRVGAYTSIAIGTDGLPVISYLDAPPSI